MTKHVKTRQKLRASEDTTQLEDHVVLRDIHKRRLQSTYYKRLL